MILTLTERLPPNPVAIADLTLALSAEERTRSRCRYELPNGHRLSLHLPRGTVLQDGDLLKAQADNSLVRVAAKPESVLTVTSETEFNLLRAAYHLGNRHVPLEITASYLRLSPDPVLQQMLEHLGLQVTESVSPFHPEPGAYGNHHAG